ncbi:hypothetical protein EMIT043CA1_230096 [Pseudomonas brassicacearum]
MGLLNQVKRRNTNPCGSKACSRCRHLGSPGDRVIFIAGKPCSHSGTLRHFAKFPHYKSLDVYHISLGVGPSHIVLRRYLQLRQNPPACAP